MDKQEAVERCNKWLTILDEVDKWSGIAGEKPLDRFRTALHTVLQSLAASEKEAAGYREALEHYANKENWHCFRNNHPYGICEENGCSWTFYETEGDDRWQGYEVAQAALEASGQAE